MENNLDLKTGVVVGTDSDNNVVVYTIGEVGVNDYLLLAEVLREKALSPTREWMKTSAENNAIKAKAREMLAKEGNADVAQG